MLLTSIHVAFGGALGAVLRYLCSWAVLRGFGAHTVPLGVMTANVLGSFAMGVVVVALAQRGLLAWQPFLMTGLLGGFTTFSAFSLETVELIETGQHGLAAAYIFLSVGLSVGGLMAGMMLAKGAFA